MPRRFQDAFFHGTFFQCPFRIDLGSTWTPTWRQLGVKNEPKFYENQENEVFQRELQFLIDV